MKPGGSRQMLTGEASRPALAGAVSESFAVADKEINGVCATICAIRNAILTLKARRLYEQLRSPRPLRCFAELVCAD
jgi:hypothetical protein